MWRTVCLAVVAVAVQEACADLYVHNPRGSNDRLNEQSANRDNGNRLFDSQNNNRGGYNVMDKTDAAFDGNDPTRGDNLELMYNRLATQSMQYDMIYHENSELRLEWTNQHGCGGNENGDVSKLNCQMIIQYMCDTNSTGYNQDKALFVAMRNGGTTDRATAPDTVNNGGDQGIGNINSAESSNAAAKPKGRHEHEAYYFECRTRTRNQGLFTADQYLQNNIGARATRQNPNGNQNGLECPEERDYYPYWHPVPWRDIAVLTDHPEMCDWYKANSYNSQPKYKCVQNATPQQFLRKCVEANNEADCSSQTGCIWRKYLPHAIPEPDCRQADYTRSNHLGNGRDGDHIHYQWKLPTLDALALSGVKVYDINGIGQAAKCAVRIRYNISTDDYDPWNTDARSNENDAQGRHSPVEQNPLLDSGADIRQGLRLALNTNQFGRTFQDRSHTFLIRKNALTTPTPTLLPWNSSTIYNLNVRGKRGNIVQTYPAIEYDFVPNRAVVRQNDFMHFQWGGSNTHNNGNPAGDGQAGDAGEGTTGTDRSNWVQMRSPGDNFPVALDKNATNFFTGVTCYQLTGAGMNSSDCALALASGGYYFTEDEVSNRSPRLSVLLNNAPASFVQGVMIKFNRPGVYYYMSTRNNSFSNRSQKGWIEVKA